MAKLNREQKREIAREVRKKLVAWSEGKKPSKRNLGICGNLNHIKIPYGKISNVVGVDVVLGKVKPELFADYTVYPIKHPTKTGRDAYWDSFYSGDQWGIKVKSKDDKEYNNRRKLACKILARSKKTVEIDSDGDITVVFGNGK